MVNQKKPLLSRDEVAGVLGVSPATVGRLVRAGELESVKVGPRLVRIKAESLKAYLSRQGRKGVADER